MPNATDQAVSPADLAPNDAPHKLRNVWSRSGSKYRIRAIALLGLNVLLFAGVGCFAYWIRTGVVFAPAMDGYVDELVETFRFGGNTSVSLAHLLVSPISVQTVPMQIPIIGLLMATLIAIPILVAILYRFWASVPFALVVGALAVMPWLAITLFGSCVLASVRPFRMRFRFMAALVALVPIVVYLVLAWHGSDEVFMGRFDPVERIKFVAPWVLAVVAATCLFAIVLFIASLVDYRPGAIAPLLALMFFLPLGLFEFRVGRDELHYRLLENLFGYHFEDVDAKQSLRAAALSAWERHPRPRPRFEQILQLEELKWQFELASDPGAARSVLVRHQAEIVSRCDWFLLHFPKSRYALNTLHIRGTALDMRVDALTFRRTKWIRFYDEFPSASSRTTWKIARQNGEDSPITAVALWKLAQLDARECDIDRAMDHLATLLRRFDSDDGPATTTVAKRARQKGVLDRDLPELTLHIGLEGILLRAHRLRDLLAENEDPIYGYAPICGPRRHQDDYTFGLLDLDPHHERYVDNLDQLLKRYPDSQLADNVELEIAIALRGSDSSGATDRGDEHASVAGILRACLKQHPTGDAVPEVLYRLGDAYRSLGQPEESRGAYARLFREHGESIWARRAMAELGAGWLLATNAAGHDG